jgi:hypothetical protein
VVSPLNNLTYNIREKILIQVSTDNTYPISKLDFYLNGNYIGSSATAPFLFSFTPTEINSVIVGENIIKIIATDLVYNKGEEEVNFKITE